MSDAELESRLRSVETTVAELAALVKHNLTSLHECVETHNLFLFGNPKNPIESPGLSVRVDRLEVRQSLRSWVVRVMIGGILTAVGAYAAQFFPGTRGK